MMFSRRQFLTMAGIAVVGIHLPAPTSVLPSFETVYGRALSSVPVYAAAEGHTPQSRYLWSDSVAPILAVSGEWYRLPEGYVRRETMQPLITPVHRSQTATVPPFWGEVSGAVGVVRAWCAADAQIVTRIGHGGVLRVVDYLAGEAGIDWYGVAESEAGLLLGWTQTAAWSPALVDRVAPSLTLTVDRIQQHLNVLKNDQVLLTAPLSIGCDLMPGVYPITERRLSGVQAGGYHGVPWALGFGDDQQLSGAYWHNRFGTATPGAALQVTPPLARWLYPRVAKVIIS